MQKIVDDRLRPVGSKDPFGASAARKTLQAAYAMIEQDMAAKTWAMGKNFSLADCAAAPALFYAAKVEPLAERFPAVDAYFSRLAQRPSYARVLAEAQPYFHMFPQ